jgi:hypothetical protein
MAHNTHCIKQNKKWTFLTVNLGLMFRHLTEFGYITLILRLHNKVFTFKNIFFFIVRIISKCTNELLLYWQPSLLSTDPIIIVNEANKINWMFSLLFVYSLMYGDKVILIGCIFDEAPA